jgi:hypothetical protein
MSKWLLIVDEVDSHVPGIVEADTPEAAIEEWVGNTFDSAPIYVIPLEAVRRYEPNLPHKTRWQESPVTEPERS